MTKQRYPYLHEFSKAIGIPPENLTKAFEIEQLFHENILEEEKYEVRQNMYSDVYNAVHLIYGKNKVDISSESNPKNKIVRLFSKELSGKSILDVGCGEGHFLASVSRNLPHEKLVGIDVSLPHLAQYHPEIEFKLGNIIDFNLDTQFDVVFSDNVIEHIAPADLSTHLASVKSALKQGGTFIVTMPNRLFGPWDVTRIMDFTNTGKVSSKGTHLNESTYTEMVPVLSDSGFNNFRTVCFIPKLKYILINYRCSTSFLRTIENSPLLLALLYNIKLHGRCVAPLDVTLICDKL